MSKKITPFLLVILIGGLIASCTTTNPLVKKEKSNIKNKNYTSALNAANTYIQQNPGDPLGYYYKGVALSQKADSEQNPDTTLFKQMDQAFTKATQIADTMSKPPKQIKTIGSMRTSIWRTQHNLGVKYAKHDSLHKTVSNPLAVSMSHLRNATIIQPDSALSWNVLAQVSGMNQDYKRAAQAQKKYLSMADSVGAKDYLILAQYYERSNQTQNAINTLQQAHQKFPQNTQAVEMLADAYSNAGESDKSISLVKKLVNENPSNGRYRLSLGTQIYQAALKLQHQYSKNMNQLISLQSKQRNASGSQADQIKQQMNKLESQTAKIKSQLDSQTAKALKQVNAAIKNGKNNAQAYNTLGVIYQNKASVVLKQRNFTLDNQKAAKLDKQANQFLRKARDNYLKAAQKDPNNKKYWRSLYQIYTALGNTKKANMAKKKAGMQ